MLGLCPNFIIFSEFPFPPTSSLLAVFGLHLFFRIVWASITYVAVRFALTCNRNFDKIFSLKIGVFSISVNSPQNTAYERLFLIIVNLYLSPFSKIWSSLTLQNIESINFPFQELISNGEFPSVKGVGALRGPVP